MSTHVRNLITLSAALLLALILLPAGSTHAADRICFTQVPDCIEGRFAEFWKQNGGLPVFGLPKSPASQQTVEGKSYLVQQFERNRFELHPENARPYDVLLGRLGDDLLKRSGRDWNTFAKVPGAPANCVFFAETGHSVCEPFLRMYRSNGLEFDGKKGKSLAESLALFGLPLSEPQVETTPDGKNYTVQWFERARFELHPENQPPYDVLLGLLGNETMSGASQPAQPTQPTQPAQPTDACADVAEPVSARIRPGKCVKQGTRVEIDVFGFTANEQIGFWITAPDGSVIGTRQTLNIGPNGGINGIPLSTNSLPVGVYSVVFQGVSSGHQSIAYFKVLPADNAGAPQQPGAVPASQNASATPSTGARGTTFRFAGTGFKPGEKVGVYVTAPDQSVFGAPFQDEADAQGTVSGISLRTDSSFPTGVYAMTFEGVESHNKAIAYFQVTQ